jgi:hypothetical protein
VETGAPGKVQAVGAHRGAPVMMRGGDAVSVAAFSGDTSAPAGGGVSDELLQVGE